MLDSGNTCDVDACGELKPIVVGVDGSSASLNALKWAEDEAVNRGVPIRLVHAVSDVRPQTATRPADRDACLTDEILLRAEDKIRYGGNSVQVESARIAGEPGEVLVRESCNALMVCMGEPTPIRPTGKLFGPTATTLAQQAQCPVAIIRSAVDGSVRDGGVVSVVLDDAPDNDAVVHLAMHEGRLRRATVRQIDRRVDSWVRRYPDVHVQTVASGTGGRYRNATQEDPQVQLAVVGCADAKDIATLGLPNCHPILGYPDCSVLLVRDGCDGATRHDAPESDGAAG